MKAKKPEEIDRVRESIQCPSLILRKPAWLPIEAAFDSFDDAAADEPVAEPHDHAPVPTSYAKGTGRRMSFVAFPSPRRSGGGLPRRSSGQGTAGGDARKRYRRKGRRSAARRGHQGRSGAADPDADSSRRNTGLVQLDHLCPRQRICGEMDRRYRRPGEEGSGARDNRHAGA